MFNSSNTREIYASAEDRLRPVAPPYQGDEKTTTRDETKYVEEDDLPEIKQENCAKGSGQKSWTRPKRNQRASLELVREHTSRRQIENKFPPRNWKPITLRYPILLSFVIISISLIATLEVLSHYSTGTNGGGLSFATTLDELSATATFFYLYFPTVLAVSYSMFWNWIDLDVKRLEPWLQLSRPDGALASDSLLLHYPFEFLAFVPIRALRRRHWAVFLGGMVMVVVFWVITPLQSAIFTTGSVNRARAVSMVTAGSLLALNDQTTALNTNFMNTAFAITWLGQKQPVYTTNDYALQPFAAVGTDDQTTTTESWSSYTTAYTTKITCKPASVTLNGSYYTFDNGDGCIVPYIALPAPYGKTKYVVLYIQYWDNAEDDWSLQNPQCTEDHSHNFLALWADASSQTQFGVYSNLTSLFCQTAYYTQKVNAEVNASSLAVIDSDFDASLPSNKTEVLSADEFNTTHFEYIIGTGVSPVTIRQDFQDVTVLEQYPRLSNYSITWPVTNMVGFAVAANPGSVADLSSPTVLQAAFDKAHKLLFSMAIAAISTSSQKSSSVEARAGLLLDQPAAIILVRPFAIIVEASLSVVALLAFLLLLYSWKRPSGLASDPATSIADIMAVVCKSNDLSYLFEDNGATTSKMLEQRLVGKRFSIVYPEAGNELTLQVLAGSLTPNFEKEQKAPRTNSSFRKKDDFEPTRPIELKIGVGLLIMGMILSSICVLVLLYILVAQRDGLSRPSTNALLLSFLENALPTAFASILEPLWVVLNRILCVLRPFEDLRIGKAKPSATIHAKYTSIPPQLVAWRALRSHHFILAGVCVIALSSNLLAVTLSILFNEAPTTVRANITSTPSLGTNFNGSMVVFFGNSTVPITYSDHYYVIMSNLLEGTSLPPWIDNEFFYIPFEIPSTPPDYVLSSQGNTNVESYNARTRAFGITTTCQTLQQKGAGTGALFQPSNNGSEILFSTGYNLPNGVTCADWPGGNETTISPGLLPDSAAAVEFLQPAAAPSTSNAGYPSLSGNQGFCQESVVLGWARVGPAVSSASSMVSNATNGRSFEYILMGCQPHLITAEATVSVDPDGHILEVTEIGPFDTNPSSYSTTNETATLVAQINNLIAQSTRHTWHNDSFTTDWINSILKTYMNSSQLVDPTAQLPDVQNIIPIVEDLYQRLAAVILGLNTEPFTAPAPNSQLNVTVTMTETRIFMSPLMFEISVTILALHLLTAVTYYTNRPKRFLPRMPTTIASLIAYVSMSHAVQDVTPNCSSAVSSSYAYGRFIGVDGKPHVGIERQSRVIPLESKNPAFRTRRSWNPASWLRRRKDQPTWI